MWRSQERDRGRKRYEIVGTFGAGEAARAAVSGDGLITVTSMRGVALVFLGMAEVRERQADLIQDKLTTVAERSRGRVAVSLAEVTALTSAGINALVAVHNRCTGLGGRLVLFAVPEEIVRMIRVTGLDRALAIAGNASEAVASCDRAERGKGILGALGLGRAKRDAA
jgi:anti-sigma B factor antagonist